MTRQPRRLPEGGLIDRNQPLSFTFNGERLEGFTGDTVASALLANGKGMVARSFKYHRPRGIYAAGVEEPSALVTVGDGARREPNAKASQVVLCEGMQVESQNHWPSLGFDLLRLNDRLSPVFSTGFYNKTFKWPRRFWPLYEKMLRKIAGMGSASSLPDSSLPGRLATRKFRFLTNSMSAPERWARRLELHWVLQPPVWRSK